MRMLALSTQPSSLPRFALDLEKIKGLYLRVALSSLASDSLNYSVKRSPNLILYLASVLFTIEHS